MRPFAKLSLKILGLQNSTRFFSNMRFVQFSLDGRRSVGVELEDGGEIVDVCEVDSSIPTNLKDVITQGDACMTKIARAVEKGIKNKGRNQQMKIECPISDPGKILCIGMNYVDHCLEQNVPVPTEPVVFSKFNNTLSGPHSDIVYPEESEQLDWEVELAIIVGKKGYRIKKAEAMDYVFGYTAAHDVSSREWQFKNGGQFLLGKSMNGFCPLGPAVVTKGALKDPHNLRLWTKVNGVTKQDGNTNQLVFKTEDVIAFISRFMHLSPGDVILTGTPPGVGVFRKPQEFLKVGDDVEIGIENIGIIRNKIVAP